MTLPVVFRCNASSRVGLGHLMRCREMARLLTEAGHACTIVGPSEDLREPNDDTLFVRWIPMSGEQGPEQDARDFIAICREAGAVHAVMDDYRVDPAYQASLKAQGIRFMQQFDASKPWDFHADIIVNSSPYERAEDYATYVKNPDAQLLLGPKYAVLRPEFSELDIRPAGRPVRRILVSFGGGDDLGAIRLTLDALADTAGAEGVTAVIVSGNSNPRNAEHAAHVATLPPGRAEFHIHPKNVAVLMNCCDLVIIAGGTMSYEAALCTLPMVLIALAPNQLRPCRGWAEQTGAEMLGTVDTVTVEMIRDALEALVSDTARRTDMALRGQAMVDKSGGQRLVSALLERDEI
ncbi:MAG TPA: UDP-2,4-diacetamido-2,4,6-trideoxy-beta-L-altropyranose hydrolase [Pararhizobium sp.]|uniref:UDP-2,4-diacetamido-2,4, 6-trideoxy-beta-L-altropyranose hydrolase n=1 Tax=Pararhizobium sp. TaxID=1977563 RepID=UPI002CDEBA98|nr:UDP-2,4-diacetamido-2,4,6-trideoxy-beta-L-altropyranose hydrolase [Pararhizobium sp.]HTO31950.1 UDP-2,4-diacetamido-2,4,6-trideoxy-beta-L-altropyranose hydrolase [Pararhizobium sp.]